MRVVLPAIAMLVLASCATQDKAAAALEVKAKAGDPVASCQLVVHDLRECAGILERWRPRTAYSRPPSCLDDPVPEAHARYLAESVGWTEGAPAETLGSQAARGASVLEVILKLAPTDDEIFSSALGILDGIEQTCPRLADDA